MNPESSTSESVQLWSEILSVMGALVLVVALIFLLSWLLRKSGRLNAIAPDRLRVVCSRSVGHREKLLLIEMDGQEILLGVTSSSINRLYDRPVDEDGFAGELNKALDAGQDSA